MKPSRLLITAGFVIAAALNVAAGEVKIICNVSVRADSISASELKSVFLLQRRTLKDGSPVVPVLEKSGATHEAFAQYLDRGSEEIQTYYQELIFTGKRSMPKELNSDPEVVAYIARTRGAIGYVSGDASTEGVKGACSLRRAQRREKVADPRRAGRPGDATAAPDRRHRASGRHHFAEGYRRESGLTGRQSHSCRSCQQSGEAMGLYAGAIPDHNCSDPAIRGHR